jgi:hypothetical protein
MWSGFVKNQDVAKDVWGQKDGVSFGGCVLGLRQFECWD